jgi:hypothetical protein
MNAPPPEVESAGDRAIRKLRAFIAGLEPDERAVLASLLRPVIERTTAQATEWSPDLLARAFDDDLRP